MHGIIGRQGPDDYAGEADAARDREAKRFTARENDPNHTVNENDDVERLREPTSEEAA
jgi:hypothetical protein